MAALWSRDGDITLRSFAFERSDRKEDMEWLLRQAEEFWHDVRTNKRPGAAIVF